MSKKLYLLKYMIQHPQWHKGEQLIAATGIKRGMIYVYLTHYIEAKIVDKLTPRAHGDSPDAAYYRCALVERQPDALVLPVTQEP